MESHHAAAEDAAYGGSKVHKNVLVREREFKSDRAHQGKITAIVRIDDNEFITACEDQSLKIWDK